jgi:hypothetical protein
MRILYNIDPIIYNYNIMGLTPLFDIIICTGPTRDRSTHSSQSESQDFWCFASILHPSFLTIFIFSTISTNNTIITINNNYSYVNMGANNANGSHAKNRIRRQFTIVPATATSKYKLKCKWCDDPPKADNITQTQGPHLDLCKGWDKAQREMRGKEQQPLEFKKEAIELSIYDA